MFLSPAARAVNVAATSTRVLNANVARGYAVFVNDSDTTIYLALGANAVANQGIRLNANGGSYEINLLNLYDGVIYAIHGSTGNKVLTVLELEERKPFNAQ